MLNQLSHPAAPPDIFLNWQAISQNMDMQNSKNIQYGIAENNKPQGFIVSNFKIYYEESN